MEKIPLPLKAMIAALTAAIPTAPLQANVVPSPQAAPSLFSSSTAAAKGATYCKGQFRLKDVASIGPAGMAPVNSTTKSTKPPTKKQPGHTKV
ncbi:MAG: hypothetical protein ABSA85_09350 [Terracidiphilus sp.]|jgi:hypothetical protein